MKKIRLIQTSIYDKQGLYKEEYNIQKNYGKIIPDWINIPEENYKDKNQALNRLEELKKDKTTKTQAKTIKVIK